MELINEIFHQFTPLIKIVCILIAALFVSRYATKASARIIRRTVRSAQFKTKRDEEQREQTLISIINTTLYVVIWVLAGLLVLGVLDIDITPLLAGAGVIGLALSFGAQSLIKDLVAGMFILLENQYRVGDVLQVNEGVSGVVEKITPRITILRDLAGQVHYVPNGSIQLATNMTMEFAQVDMNIGVGYTTDIDKLEKVINRTGEQLAADDEWKDIVLEPATMLRVDSFGDSAINVKIVCKTAPIQQWAVQGELLRRLKKAFEKEGIEIPFPQRVIHEAKQSA